MKRVEEEKDDSVDYALLEAIWWVLASDSSNPRRMHTRDIVYKLVNQDEGRWRAANRNGREIDDYYLRERLKKLLPTDGYYAQPKSRRWRPATDPKGNPLYGYHELHFEDAFSRYLGKGLPSLAPSEPESADDDPLGPEPDPRPNPQSDSDIDDSSDRCPFPDGAHNADSSDTGDTASVNGDISDGYNMSDDPSPSSTVSDAYSTREDPIANKAGSVPDPFDTVSNQNEHVGTKNDEYNQCFESNVSSVADETGSKPHAEEDSKNTRGENLSAAFPRGAVGRRARRGAGARKD
jgi:hypothetical protein